MKSSTLLDSVVFQLTPTRTRCDLFIIANDKKEKIASGLLTPFLAHLGTAQDQIAKGGYSILLEPDTDVDAPWFTKGTVERFVRFVSTPEILERVYTIESEILQIEEAIALQGNNDSGQGRVEYKEAKSAGKFAGTKSTADVNEEKAIVLYKPGEHRPQTDSQEENSRVQLLKVLETRKSVLQKEQGMAFARAVAAGFDIDRMAQMVSFSESFGASRLRDACVRFMELWKKKHENGQWVEIEAAEAMANQLDIAAMNASGIQLSNVANKQFDSNSEMASDNGNSGERPPFDQQSPNGQQQYQYMHPMFPPWAMHSPPSALPPFQGYPMQGVPYYPAYPGNGHPYQHPYPGMENSPTGVTPRSRQKRRSLDRRESNSDSEEGEEMDSEGSHSQRKKAGRSRKNKSGKVVIRNINYITSKAKNSSDSESEAASGSEKDVDSEDLEGNGHNPVNKQTSRSPKTRRSRTKLQDESISYDDTVCEKEPDGGHWLAFQNCLLKGNEEERYADKDGMFAMEKDARRRPKSTIANGEVLLSSRGYDNAQGLGDQMDMHFTEINGRKVMPRTANDEFMLNGRENQSGLRNSLDPLAVNAFEHTNKLDKASSHDMTDESFIVPFRSMSLDGVGPDGRTAINMESELPSMHQKSENNSAGIMSYEPNDLSMMPERGTEKISGVYDPAFDYEMQVCIEGSASKDKRKNGVSNEAKEGSKKSEKDRRSKATVDTSDKKRSGGPIRKGKMSKSSPLDDARARAERIRSFKADMQKMKKEKEEADQKRIEALKLERQKRIASRGGSSSGRSPASTTQTRKLPAKSSPGTFRGSKFSDSEPGSSSPLQRTKIRTSLGSSDLQKGSKASKSTDGSKLAGSNKLSRSASSLSEPKKKNNGVTPDSKASMARIRRLSEPKAISSKPDTLRKAQSAELSKPKARSAEPVSKTKRSDVPESKKISAIIDLDKKKAATLPELKIRTTKDSSDLPQEKPAAEIIAKEKNDRPSVASEGIQSYKNDLDENIIEKTVVMLEKEKSSLVVEECDHIDSVEKTDYASTRDPPSPFEGFIRVPVPSQLQELPNSHETGTSYADDTPKFANIGSTVYRAPYARVSSIEDPCTRNLEFVKAPPSSSDTGSTVKEIAKAHAPDIHTVRVDNNPEAAEKTQVKESPKGFKRLLRFAKKNHTSAGAESNGTSMSSIKQDDSATNASLPGEVYTLKNLISQDETPTAGNVSQKSRLSLLSPFRSKTSEKR
ncbi:COP1-interacting protein 7 [Lycium barbarum]|uniref:COP1-interacting protein 7 n=1 Tax=Lycium barbarum TaxID=112863 RepID=UPI00293EDA25|nr:COP1-interacting protein 7 [Lycium barbarum]XP_060181902.1 COP1-interacting protein 7 [Lycium barbarum]XP_060181903.1 COP1-interacting protein 7 [Lycium barbarum]